MASQKQSKGTPKERLNRAESGLGLALAELDEGRPLPLEGRRAPFEERLALRRWPRSERLSALTLENIARSAVMKARPTVKV